MAEVEQTCDNCKYFGGCCCDHVDEDGKCLGWEEYIPMMPDEDYDKLIHKAADIVRGMIERGELPPIVFKR